MILNEKVSRSQLVIAWNWWIPIPKPMLIISRLISVHLHLFIFKICGISYLIQYENINTLPSKRHTNSLRGSFLYTALVMTVQPKTAVLWQFSDRKYNYTQNINTLLQFRIHLLASEASDVCWVKITNQEVLDVIYSGFTFMPRC